MLVQHMDDLFLITPGVLEVAMTLDAQGRLLGTRSWKQILQRFRGMQLW